MPALYEELEQRSLRRFQGVSARAMCISTLLYTMVGLAGCAARDSLTIP